MNDLFSCVSLVDLPVKMLSQLAGFEPTRAEPIGFQVQRLNHSATTALEMRGIEPRAFHMQSERSTTELHPLPCNTYKNFQWYIKILVHISLYKCP